MRELGLAPDFLMCRGQRELEDGSRKKLAMFCQVNFCSLFIDFTTDISLFTEALMRLSDCFDSILR
jgi:CTP synthase (UTP-ammonia lyase)